MNKIAIFLLLSSFIFTRWEKQIFVEWVYEYIYFCSLTYDYFNLIMQSYNCPYNFSNFAIFIAYWLEIFIFVLLKIYNLLIVHSKAITYLEESWFSSKDLYILEPHSNPDGFTTIREASFPLSIIIIKIITIIGHFWLSFLQHNDGVIKA